MPGSEAAPRHKARRIIPQTNDGEIAVIDAASLGVAGGAIMLILAIGKRRMQLEIGQPLIILYLYCRLDAQIININVIPSC